MSGGAEIIGGKVLDVEYSVPISALSGVPPWDPADGSAVPLTRDQAVEIAKQEAAKMGKANPPERSLSVALKKIFLRGPDVSRVPACCEWIYVISLEEKANPPALLFMVTMSGTVANATARTVKVR